ncbi:MAG: glycosyltransferase, partial [Candidatus Brocadiaceae bacterium]
MRILQINNYHYIKGGSDRVYFETSKLLEEKGHTVIHFSVNDKEALESPYKKYFLNGIDFLKKDKLCVKNILRFVYSHEAREKLENLIRNENPEIAHLHIFYGRIGLSILPVLKKYNIPAVMTVHEYKVLCPMYNFLNRNEEICEKCAKGNYFYCVINRCNRNSFLYSFVSALECYVRDSLFNYEKYIDKFIMVSKFIQEKHLKYKPHLR